MLLRSGILLVPRPGQQLWLRLGMPKLPQRMLTVRNNVARMLLSTNQSHIVDISHDEELKRGVKTSGEKFDPNDDKNKTVVEQFTDRVTHMKDKAKESVKHAGETVKHAGETVRHAGDRFRGSSRQEESSKDKSTHQQASSETEKAMGSFEDAPEFASREGERSQTMMQTEHNPIHHESIHESMEKVGNSTSRTGTTNADRENDESIQKEQLGERLDAKEHNANKSGSIKDDDKPLQIHAEDWDVAAKVMHESPASVGGQDVDVDFQHIQPGTRNLRGTDDNFDDDPAISIDDMKEKVLNTKDKLTGGMDSASQSMKHASENVREAVKGVTDPVKEKVKGAATMAKEFVTGEKDREKPDMRQSPVRTKEGDFPPGTPAEKVVDKNKQNRPSV